MSKELGHISSDTLNYPIMSAWVMEEYSVLLDNLNVEYKNSDYYPQVGEINRTQGWIIHISVIISQLNNLLQVILPGLIEKRIPFKIAKDKGIARFLLNGNFGSQSLGKVVCIYPNTDKEACSLAIELITMTTGFQGPPILTDVRLGEVIYTRYGSFKPVVLENNIGIKENYIYSTTGELIKDIRNIPFKAPENISWPFEDIITPKAAEIRKILNKIYKPLTILKQDLRGHVIKGIYIKGIMHIAGCLIKQGVKNMISDDNGRDICDRLLWQKELQEELSEKIPLPKIIDYFEEAGDFYLVMEFIKGVSLYDRLLEINKTNTSWFNLPSKDQLEILNYLHQILNSVSTLHASGYVHRDITTVNFLVTKNKKVFLIDIELAYSERQEKPSPPFDYGTPGFMSPEQMLIRKPTQKEDIYGLGALMVEVFTGLTPIKFSIRDQNILRQNLSFFIRHDRISSIIANCLNTNPKLRPSLVDIKSSLEDFIRETKKSGTKTFKNSSADAAKPELRDFISKFLTALGSPPLQVDGLWFSQTKNTEGVPASKQKAYSLYPGIYEGLSGVLYFLAQSQKRNLNISSCLKGYYKAWDFIERNYLSNISQIASGLYSGASGIALACAAGLDTSLLKDREKGQQWIQICLRQPCATLDLATGLSGQTLAALHCAHYLEEGLKNKMIDDHVNTILNAQQKNGSWLKPYNTLSQALGMPGIIWVLLEYMSKKGRVDVGQKIRLSLDWICKESKNLEHFFDPKNKHRLLLDPVRPGDEIIGTLTCFIKAYEVLHETKYMQIVEDALLQYPETIVLNNLTLSTGLAGLGAVYLKAYSAFKNEKWLHRANWIADSFIHNCFRDNDDKCYWLIEETTIPTADLMVGNTGIIYFLLNKLEPDTFDYKLPI